MDLMIAKLDTRLRDKDMAIDLTPAAKRLLAEKGYDPVLGARPLRRAIQREIEDALSEKILLGEIKPGQTVIVDVEGEGVLGEFTFRGVPKGDKAVPVAAAAPSASAAAAAAAASGRHAGGSSSGGLKAEANS